MPSAERTKRDSTTEKPNRRMSANPQEWQKVDSLSSPGMFPP